MNEEEKKVYQNLREVREHKTGWWASLSAMPGGRAKLETKLVTLGVSEEVYNTWEFPSVSVAREAYAQWDRSREEEPTGWDYHAQTRRYRILGHPDLEYFRVHMDDSLKNQMEMVLSVIYEPGIQVTRFQAIKPPWLDQLPEGTRVLLLESEHLLERESGEHQRCFHNDFAFLYQRRCVVMKFGDLPTLDYALTIMKRGRLLTLPLRLTLSHSVDKDE